MRSLIAALALLFVSPAFAAETTLNWTNPTQYRDSSPLNAADILSHRVEWTGNCPNFGFIAANIVVAGNATSLLVVNITPGTRCFRVFVTAKDPRCVVTATETCVVESPPSALWSKTFANTPPVAAAPRTPNAPTGLGGD